jgi:hypothetical protein
MKSAGLQEIHIQSKHDYTISGHNYLVILTNFIRDVVFLPAASLSLFLFNQAFTCSIVTCNRIVNGIIL